MNFLSEFVRDVGAKWLWAVLALIVLCLLALVGLAVLGFAGNSWLGRGEGVALALSLGLLGVVAAVVGVQRLAVAANQALQQARQTDVRVREAVDAMPAGFALYDPDDRLVLCNKVIGEIFPHLAGENIVGKTYEQLIRMAMNDPSAPFPVPPEQREAWLAKTLVERRQRTGPVLRSVADGRWFHHYERLTPSHHLVVLRLDVTELVQKSQELELVAEKMARQSTTDGLTGIANRRLFDQSLQKEWQRSARNQQPVSLLLVDIDYFKRYNDRYGHLMGDECLRQVAQTLESCVKRSGELVARYGGEEFALLLPGTDANEATIAAQRCASEIARAKIMHADSSVSPWLTLSIGVVTMVASPEKPPETLVKQADLALYSAKAAGRARFEVAPESAA